MKIDGVNEFRIQKIVWCLFFQSWWLEGAKIWKDCFCLLKVILSDVSAKLVLGKATPLGNVIFVCQNRFFQFPPGRGSSSIAGALEGVGAWKSDFCLPKTVFSLRAGALGGRGLQKWFSLAEKRFFRLPPELVFLGMGPRGVSKFFFWPKIAFLTSSFCGGRGLKRKEKSIKKKKGTPQELIFSPPDDKGNKIIGRRLSH